MIGGIAIAILVMVIFVAIGCWIDGIARSDGKCDPSDDCESCPFPCENHEKKRSDKK